MHIGKDGAGFFCNAHLADLVHTACTGEGVKWRMHCGDACFSPSHFTYLQDVEERRWRTTTTTTSSHCTAWLIRPQVPQTLNLTSCIHWKQPVMFTVDSPCSRRIVPRVHSLFSEESKRNISSSTSTPTPERRFNHPKTVSQKGDSTFLFSLSSHCFLPIWLQYILARLVTLWGWCFPLCK